MQRYYSLEDAFYDVSFFNKAFGGVPENGLNPESDEFFSKALNQSKLVLEEAKELVESAEGRDGVNLLKEACDVIVTIFGLIDLLEKSGYDFEAAMECVNDNNLSKMLDDEEDAQDTAKYHKASGVDCYVESKDIDGCKYYFVRRSADGKLLKPVDYKKADVACFVPFSN